MKSRDENGHHEQRRSGEFVCLTVEIGCALEKLYYSTENGIRIIGEATRYKGGLCGTSTQEARIFEILVKRFGSGLKGHQAMMRFEKRRQRDGESSDCFLDNPESFKRRSDPE